MEENEKENEKLQEEINQLYAELASIKQEIRVLKKEKGKLCSLRIFKIKIFNIIIN